MAYRRGKYTSRKRQAGGCKSCRGRCKTGRRYRRTSRPTRRSRRTYRCGRRLRGRGERWNKFKARVGRFFGHLRPVMTGIAKDTLVPIGKDFLMGNKPTANSVVKHFGQSLKSNLFKGVV